MHNKKPAHRRARVTKNRQVAVGVTWRVQPLAVAWQQPERLGLGLLGLDSVTQPKEH